MKERGKAKEGKGKEKYREGKESRMKGAERQDKILQINEEVSRRGGEK